MSDVGSTGVRDWQTAGAPHVWMPYSQMKTASMPVAVSHTSGSRIHLADGRVLIDGLASWWSACHGYNHPHIRDAVEQQLRRMPHIMFGGIHHEPALTLARRLAALLPGDLNRVFFSDSGSVAVEVALKTAVQFWINRGFTGRTRFVSFNNAYHGDTLGAMSVCDPSSSMHAHFAGYLPSQFSHAIPDSDESRGSLLRLINEHRGELAGLIIEPLIQGAGGMKFHPPETLAWLRSLCDDTDLLLIADEIATGFGRTGSMFACEQADVVPDIMCIGKALTGGTVGMAATISREHVFDAFLSDDFSHALMHGPTFMANPLACAAANASLDLFEREPRLAQVRAIDDCLREGLAGCRTLPGVADVRVRGAVGVVQFAGRPDFQFITRQLLDAGVWLRPFGDILYTTPPLTITLEDLRQVCHAMVEAVASSASRPHGSPNPASSV